MQLKLVCGRWQSDCTHTHTHSSSRDYIEKAGNYFEIESGTSSGCGEAGSKRMKEDTTQEEPNEPKVVSAKWRREKRKKCGNY